MVRMHEHSTVLTWALKMIITSVYTLIPEEMNHRSRREHMIKLERSEPVTMQSVRQCCTQIAAPTSLDPQALRATHQCRTTKSDSLAVLFDEKRQIKVMLTSNF
jgi:hypothetical protein